MSSHKLDTVQSYSSTGKNLSIVQKLHLITVICTMLCSRLFLALSWQQSWMEGIKEDHWHHAYTGILIAVITIVIPQKFPRSKAFFMGIGLGLIFDEITVVSYFLGLNSEFTIGYWEIGSWGSAIVVTALYVWWHYKD